MEKKNDFHKLENHLFTSKNKLFLRLFTPNSNNGFYQQQNSSDENILFLLIRKSTCTSRMKDIEK